QYGPLKADTAEAVIELLRPLQERFAELAADPAETARILAMGAEKARKTASATMVRVRDRLGLPPLCPGRAPARRSVVVGRLQRGRDVGRQRPALGRQVVLPGPGDGQLVAAGGGQQR